MTWGCEWRHAPEACAEDLGGFEKKSVELSSASGEDGWPSLARCGLVSGAHVVWGRWKSQVYLSPYVEKPLNSKVIKSFVPELSSRKCFFVFRDSYVLCIYIMNILCTFHISISVSWVWYTTIPYSSSLAMTPSRHPK